MAVARRTKNMFDRSRASLGFEISGEEIIASPDWFVSDFIMIDSSKSYCKSLFTALGCLEYDADKNYIRRSNFASHYSPEFTPETVYIRVNGPISEIDTYQIEEGTSVTSYAPYLADAVKIVRTSTVNIFDMDRWIANIQGAYHGNVSISGNVITLTATSEDAYTVPFVLGDPTLDPPYRIYVKPNTTYTLSWRSLNHLSGLVYVFENGVVSGKQHADNGFTDHMTFTTGDDTEFLTFRVGVQHSGETITFTDIQLEEGDEATPYKPYKREEEAVKVVGYGDDADSEVILFEKETVS